jgi:hypothetical protein
MSKITYLIYFGTGGVFAKYNVVCPLDAIEMV